MTNATLATRPERVRRGILLNYLIIGYNAVEAIVSVAAGLVSGSVALVSFGVDSGIEGPSSLAAHCRLCADADPQRRERAERLTHRIIGGSFLALASRNSCNVKSAKRRRSHRDSGANTPRTGMAPSSSTQRATTYPLGLRSPAAGEQKLRANTV